MDSGPVRIIETVAGKFLPVACREEILGDMRQRHRGSARYVVEAVQTIPCVIISRIRRTTDPLLAVAEGFSMLSAFVAAAWWLDRSGMAEPGFIVRFAIPPMVFLTVTILADAYANPKKRPPLRPLLGPVLGFVLAYGLQSALHEWALHATVFAWGSVMSSLFLCAVRLMFVPAADRPQTAIVPAFWQRLELSPFSLNLKGVLLAAAMAVAVIIYILQR